MPIDEIKLKVAAEFGYENWEVAYLDKYPLLNAELLDATITEAIKVGKQQQEN